MAWPPHSEDSDQYLFQMEVVINQNLKTHTISEPKRHEIPLIQRFLLLKLLTHRKNNGIASFLK